MSLSKSLGKSLATLAVLLVTNAANASTAYILTLTNGGPMPVSPAAIYVKAGQLPKAQIGSSPTTGFVQLCQTGNPSVRSMELDASPEVTFLTQTTAPILPGESKEIEVLVDDPQTQSIQIETMYGKTKDLCAVGSVGSHNLIALQQHVTGEYLGKDNVVGSGAFLDPSIPMGRNYLDMSVCQGQMDAVSCLRALSQRNAGSQKIRFFGSYLSSVEMLLENRYGAAETQSLILPASGAIQIQLKLKH